MLIVMQVLLVILAVDFGSGLLHWMEDSYGQPDWPITGELITKPNLLHHKSPAAFTTKTWLQSADVLLVMAAAAVGLAGLIGAMTWQFLMFVAIGVNANQIHKWNHIGRKRRGTVVVTLQKLGVLQTGKHHGKHHTGAKDSHYCLITNIVNPVLDRLRFWRGLEWGVKRFLGVSKRAEV